VERQPLTHIHRRVAKTTAYCQERYHCVSPGENEWPAVKAASIRAKARIVSMATCLPPARTLYLKYKRTAKTTHRAVVLTTFQLSQPMLPPSRPNICAAATIK